MKRGYNEDLATQLELSFDAPRPRPYQRRKYVFTETVFGKGLQGEKLLCAAMLVQAISDSFDRDKKIRNSALWWFQEVTPQDGCLSFKTCCEALGYSPERFRETLGEWRAQYI